MARRNARTGRTAKRRSAGLTAVPAKARPSFIEQYRGAILAAVVIAVVVALGVIAILKFGPSNSGKEAAAGAQQVDPAVLSAVTQIPGSVFDSVGAGSAMPNAIKPISGAPALTDGGKPEVLYIGAEYCPYCAAERWAMIAALSRFGTFNNLHTVRSSASDVFPNTPTFTFFQSTYDSQYLTFTPVEQYTNQPSGSGYSKLQDLTSDQQAVMSKYNPQGGIPFVDFAGKYSFSGATYSPGVLGGLSWQQIATDLSTASSPQAQGIVGSANVISAAICQATNQQPADVCGAAGVQKAAAQLGKG